MQWFRWYHGTCADPKMGSIARRAGTTRERVIAVWAMVLESASEGEERGVFQVDAEGVADCLNCETESVRSILAAMEERGMVEGSTVTKWEERQRSADNSAERVRKHRQKAKKGGRNVTATVTRATVTPPERERDTESETTPTNHQARATLGEENHISLVIRLANRGMGDNPLIDQHRFRPILPTHGDSRQVVAEWRAAGIDWPTIEATVYDRASKYKPNERYAQIGTLTYFGSAVLEAHERRAALDISPPELPTEEQAASGFQFLSGDPALQEWATAIDAQLRGAIETDAVLRQEMEQIRANLRRLNEQDREFKGMRATDQEAFLWIRILNWYGERTGNQRPSSRRLAATGT